MIIGIDGNEANVQRKVGIGEYAFELLKQFEQFRIQNLEFRIYLKQAPRAEMPKESENWKYKVFGPKKYWTQFGLPAKLYLEREKPSVFFSPSHYAPRFSPVPTAIAIMDVSYLHFPQLFAKKDLMQLKNWTAYSVRKAKRIFTISQASKNDIIEAYGIPAEKVIVTYPGIKAQSEKRKMKNKQTTKSPTPYILFVGTLQPRKNIERLIEAFAKLEKKNLELVIVGKKGWLFEEILAAPKKFGVEDRVKFLDFVSDAELAKLYKNALMFVLPSLYEGFGLPVLEAMQHGCPVITSNVSSLPEAGGDAALYVDPTNIDDIAGKMKQLLESESLRKELIEKGYKQVKKFSWEKTAKKTLEVLESIAV
ncbi:MAG TPA: glycosyltransferase family 1 protein [Candidatus Saccharimonadales bacterium]|nr:glycosyltransferase family 1 protein [Candidatus Saccharimonadales bacterium]